MTLARDNYLETEVLSASAPKLHLMLVEGAIRAAEKARVLWQEGNDEQACFALIRSREFVTAMTSGLNREAFPELAGRLASVYMFVFRSLVRANMEHSETALDEALRVLTIERETWRAACEKLKQGSGDAPPLPTRTQRPSVPHFAADYDIPAHGFSFEA